jgi:hypothetical protein
MADKDEIILKIKEKIAKLDKESASSYREQLKGLDKINAELTTYQKLLSNINTTLEDQLNGFEGLLKEIQGINDELEKEGKYVRDATKAFRGLESIASKLKNDQKGYTDLNKDQLKQEKSKLRILHDQAKTAAEAIKRRGAQTEEEEAILKAYEDQFSIFQRTNKLLEIRIKEEEKINKKLGVTGVLLDGMSKIPIVGPLLKANDALDLAREKAKAGGNAFTVMGTAVASIGKNLLSSLTDPLVVVGLLAKTLTIIKDLLFSVDSTAESLARNMDMTYLAALNTFEQLRKINGDTLATAKDYAETLSFVGEQLGSNAQLNEKDLVTFTKLRIQAGLTNEELMGATKLSLANGASLEDNINTIMKTTSEISKQKGIYLNEKTIVKDIGKVSAAITLTLGKNSKELANAVATAKALGMEMSKLEDISNSLLNFEQSIEDELSAELLIGKDINLERARLAALNGDIATLAEEINNEIGSSADFSKMNVIQQEALAKAVGMNREELAKTLFVQDQLKGLNADEASRRQALLDQRIEEVGLAQAKKELETEGIERLEQQAGIQTQINQFIEQVKETFANEFIPYLRMAYEYFQSIVKEAGGMDKLVENIKTTISSMVNYAKLFFQIWASIKAAQLAYNTASIAGLAIQKLTTKEAQKEAGAETVSAAMKSVGWTPVVGLALAAAAAIGTYFSLSSLMNDGMIPPAGGSGYGKRVLYGPEGSIQLNNKDTIVAGTDLFGGGSGNINPSSPSSRQVASGGPIQVTVYGQIDKQTLFTFMAEGERTNSNNLGPERQINNRGIQ